jgi:predicted O-linked N-acetylglucosamine transferase (SPINDLY family)
MPKSIPSVPDVEADIRKGIEENPQNAKAYYDLGYLLAQNPARTSEAETAYHQAIALEPNNAKYIYRLGLLLHDHLHRFGEAEIAYHRAVELAPENPFYYGGLISLLVQQSRRSEALVLSIKMRALLNAGETWYGLATLDAILGNADAAFESLVKATRANKIDREWARNDPDLASIRSDPRFDDIIGR